MAKLCGFGFSERVVQSADLEPMMKEWLTWDGPAFLEVITDRNEVLYPIVRPGTSYKEMDLGPYIRNISN